MSDKIVTLASFTYPAETFTLVTQLEAAGIRCFTGDENLVSAQPFLSNAIGGVKVRVREEDLPKAVTILKRLEEEKREENRKAEEEWKGYVKVHEFCPECESSNIYRKKASLFSFGPNTLVCADCRHSWKQ